MARVTKEPEVRREELLDVALDLCVSDGFESTSVERITNAAGVAKGTFYHYFTSKQDLLVQLVRRFGDGLFDYLEREMAAVHGEAVTQLRELIRLSGSWKMDRVDTSLSYVPFLFKPENYTLRHQLFSEWLERTRPLLVGIVAQGAREGAFDVDDADATTSVILTLWFDAVMRVWERAIAAPDDDTYVRLLVAGTNAVWTAQERILGAPKGSLSVEIDPAAFVGTRSMFLEML
jgi:AcrR family transcriptional regulator